MEVRRGHYIIKEKAKSTQLKLNTFEEFKESQNRIE